MHVIYEISNESLLLVFYMYCDVENDIVFT